LKIADLSADARRVPCLEFASSDIAYTSSENTVRMGAVSCGYYDNRYWTMWKLPMFGCSDPSQVLREVAACTKAFPDAYVRLVSFDPIRQVQMCGFLVQRPSSAKDWKAPEARSVGSGPAQQERSRPSYSW
jgi:ribulose-bisphosphate carboxylase small chain